MTAEVIGLEVPGLRPQLRYATLIDAAVVLLDSGWRRLWRDVKPWYRSKQEGAKRTEATTVLSAYRLYSTWLQDSRLVPKKAQTSERVDRLAEELSQWRDKYDGLRNSVKDLGVPVRAPAEVIPEPTDESTLDAWAAQARDLLSSAAGPAGNALIVVAIIGGALLLAQSFGSRGNRAAA